MPTTTTKIPALIPSTPFAPTFYAAEVDVVDEPGRYEVEVRYSIDAAGGTYCLRSVATAYYGDHVAHVGATRYGGYYGAALLTLDTTGTLRERVADNVAHEVALALRDVDPLAADLLDSTRYVVLDQPAYCSACDGEVPTGEPVLLDPSTGVYVHPEHEGEVEPAPCGHYGASASTSCSPCLAEDRYRLGL